MEYYTAERKKALLPFARAWMDLENIMRSGINQVVKDKYHMISPIRNKKLMKNKIYWILSSSHLQERSLSKNK